ncbi:hypothetical protein AVEN_40109-1, partial [Araneus ventricosus]
MRSSSRNVLNNKESFEFFATSPTSLSNDAGSEHIKGNDKNPVIPSELPPRNH